MTRIAGLLVALTLLAPFAAANPLAPTNGEDVQPALPDLRPIGRALASGAAAATGAAGDAASAASQAATFLASAVASAFAALGHGLAALASGAAQAIAAFVSLLATALSAAGAALAALGVRGARYAAEHPRESAIAAGTLTGGGLLAYAAKRLWLAAFLPLYSRLARSEMLDNEVRARVYAHVQQNPGAHPSGIAHTLGLGWGTVVYHLARLEESSLVTARAGGHRKCYFVVGADLDQNARGAVAAMSTDKARAIVDALRASPGLSQKALAESVGMSQALASWHVKRLVASGVLVATREGRSNLLHVAEHVPVLRAPATPVAA